MKVVFDERQLLHAPAQYFRRGQMIDHPEQPQRAILLRDALAAAGHEIVRPEDRGLDPIYAVHDRGYVDFLASAWPRWVEATGSTVPAVPNYHTGRRSSRPPAGVVGALGYYSTDTACPLTEGTWQAIYWSAQSALEAASIVAEGALVAYALSRPPGHHAYRDASNGFCFLNNAAIAAGAMADRFGTVALLDIDTHAGNGTQDIFYAREDVLVVSLHVDPSDYPPYYMGYPDETGEGPGTERTLNIVLKPGCDEAGIFQRLEQAIAAISEFAPQVLVVSLGFDMAADDPLSEVGITTDGFRRAAALISSLGLPSVLVQEGGYLGPSLGRNAVAFLGDYKVR